MVSKLAGDKGMSLLMSLMVSVVIDLEFTIASTSTSNVCNDLSSKLFPCILTKAFRIPLAVLHLQILVYSTVVHVVEGFPQFFNCPNEVTSVVRPHLPNVSSSPYKPS